MFLRDELGGEGVQILLAPRNSGLQIGPTPLSGEPFLSQ